MGRRAKYEYTEAHKAVVKTAATELYLKGHGLRAIVALIEQEHNISVTHTTVKNYIWKAIDEWKADRIDSIDRAKATELQRIDKLEITYHVAWEKSLEQKRKTKDRQRASPIGQNKSMEVLSAVKEVQLDESLGDPRYLQGIQWCIEMRCKILGIEAPTAINMSHKGAVTHKTVFTTRKRTRP